MTAEEVKKENEMVETNPTKVKENKGMKVPSVLDVKEVPDETLSVYNLIREGYTQAEIRTMFAGWKQKKFTAIWGRAKDLMAHNVKELEEAKADVVTKYMDLYRKAYKVGNVKECKNILDSLCKVQGLNRDVNIQADFFTVWK